MHGVGDPFVKKAFELYGFPPYIPVKEQQKPDPEFSTVKFPNPEEKGEIAWNQTYSIELINNKYRRIGNALRIFCDHKDDPYIQHRRIWRWKLRTLLEPTTSWHKTRILIDSLLQKNGEIQYIY